MVLPGCPAWPEEWAEHYRELGCWRGETFGGMLRQRAAAHGDRVAIVSGDRRISYAELDASVDRLAAGFRNLGIRPRDRVIVQLPNIPQFFEVIFALFRLGPCPFSRCRRTARARSSIYANSPKRRLILSLISTWDLITGSLPIRCGRRLQACAT